CDGVNDCSDSLYNHWYVNNWNNPNDKLWMQFDLTVPLGTEGYVFDFAYFSSEFPSWYNTQYNDLFIAWSTSETYTGNLTFVNGAPLTITSLEDAGAFQYKNNAAQLAGTGFEGHAGTGWFTARGSAAPEESFQITFFIADMADSVLATGVLLDNFRWECAGCVPSEVDSCGIQPQ
ncbi:MAG: choice-of-anchor L domain-containing protein, partial [Myxococcales bacterium]|nr:choice-of-anchor L domain-containing protein [Myxococcales bacterium]